MRVRIVFGRPAVGRPARVADADRAAQRLAVEPVFQRAQFALRPPAAKNAFFKRGDSGRVVAAVLETLERIDELARDRLGTDNSDDPAHPFGWLLCSFAYGLAAAVKPKEIKPHFA